MWKVTFITTASTLFSLSWESQMFRSSEAFWLKIGVKDLSWAGPKAGFCEEILSEL